MSQLFASGGQSIGASASASVLSMTIQGWFLLGLTGLISLPFNLKASIVQCSVFFMVQLSHPCMTTGKIIALTIRPLKKFFFIRTFVSKVVSLLFNTLSRFVIPFLTRSKCLLISRLQSPSAVILEPKKIACHCFHLIPIYLLWSYGTGCHDLIFLNVELYLSQLFHSPLSPSSRGSLVPLHILQLEWCHLLIRGYWNFSRQPWIQLVLHPAWHFTWCTLHVS